MTVGQAGVPGFVATCGLSRRCSRLVVRYVRQPKVKGSWPVLAGSPGVLGLAAGSACSERDQPAAPDHRPAAVFSPRLRTRESTGAVVGTLPFRPGPDVGVLAR